MAPSKFARAVLVLLVTVLPYGCAPAPVDDGTSSAEGATAFACDPDDGGILLPEGFCATVFADGLGATRHLVVDAEGDVYAARRRTGRRGDDGAFEIESRGGVVALRDSDGDGKADVQEAVNEVPGTGIALYDGYLYYSSDVEVFRVPLQPGELLPVGEPESIVSGFPDQGQHAAKSITIDDAGRLYVNVGGPSNACQEELRTPGSPGQDPCPQREWQASVWRFDAATPGQTQQADGLQYARGIRNAVALEWNQDAGSLYVLQHGRDSLAQLWPDLYTEEESAELPAEEMFRVGEGDDFGWPYCYYDGFREAKVLAPEYGGDGETIGRCADAEGPVVAFPAHWAPNDLVFYDHAGLPGFRGGAFVAFHGSWNRMPFPQQGYNVVFVPFADGEATGGYEVFAEGFEQTESVRMPGDAAYRPTGLAVGPDGSLFVSDDSRGRIWRIRATRPRAAAGE